MRLQPLGGRGFGAGEDGAFGNFIGVFNRGASVRPRIPTLVCVCCVNMCALCNRAVTRRRLRKSRSSPAILWRPVAELWDKKEQVQVKVRHRRSVSPPLSNHVNRFAAQSHKRPHKRKCAQHSLQLQGRRELIPRHSVPVSDQLCS